MKAKLFLIICMLWSGLAIGQSSTSLDQFFNTYQDDPAFTVVTISPKLFQMFSKLDLDEENDDIKEMVSSITSLRILARDEADGTKLYQDAITQITRSDYEELLTVRDGGENVKFLIREGSGDIIKQLILLVGGEDSFVLLDINGNIDLKTIGKLGNTLDIPGAQHLEKVNEKK